MLQQQQGGYSLFFPTFSPKKIRRAHGVLEVLGLLLDFLLVSRPPVARITFLDISSLGPNLLYPGWLAAYLVLLRAICTLMFTFQKIIEKLLGPKTTFSVIFGFFDLPDVNSGPFWVPKRVPGDDFWVIFEGKTWSRFRNTFFDDFFLEKTQKREK